MIEPVRCKERGDRPLVRVDPARKATFQKRAEGRIGRFVRSITRFSLALQKLCEQLHLRRFPASVKTLENDEFSSFCIVHGSHYNK